MVYLIVYIVLGDTKFENLNKGRNVVKTLQISEIS